MSLISALLQDLSDARATNYLTVVAATLIVFDHLITIQQEVDLIWRSPRNLTSFLYICNRYCTLTVIVVSLSYMFRTSVSDKSCVQKPNFLLA
ncbi:hypothetical protein BD779DRAFT_1535588 [Infundibulicybe gibba]|nr:hypothetical protein BD779DRAFT_1535588 [Infundibulicybe gibba]